MTNKTFSPGTVIDSPWLNDVNDTVYDILGDGVSIPATKAAARTNLGLGSVDNTSDLSKPISTATQTALNLKANLASPALTGNPTAPTPATGDNDTSIATTAFVQNTLKAMPSFQVYRSGALSLTASMYTPVIFDTKVWDTNNFYSTATGRFTPTIPGYYRVSARTRAGGNMLEVNTTIYKNGVLAFEGTLTTLPSTAVASASASVVTSLVQMNGTTDYITISTYCSTSTGNGTLVTGAANAYFSGELVSAL